MDIRKLQRAIVDGLEDVKAQAIVVFNTEHLSPLFERVIVASGTSNRQTKALAASVRDAVKSSGQQVLRTEGEDNGEWIIVDCGAAVAHIMQPAIRDYYRLEEIWGGKPVKLKLADDKVSLPKASEGDDEDAPAPKKAAAKKAPAKKAPAKKSAGHAAPTEKSAAGRAALGQSAPKRRTAADAVSAKKPTAARKVSSGTVATKATSSKPAARKAAPARPAPKAPARKAAPVKAAAKASAKKPAAKKAVPARKTTAR